MKKVNKKLASAIVLGLMLAVPVGVSAAEVETVTIDTNGSALTQEKINELNGKNVVFTNSKESGQIFTSNKDGVEVKVDGVKTIQLDGRWTNNAFYASNGGILTINADKIETISDKNAGRNLLQSVGGKMTITANEFYVSDESELGTGLYAQRNNDAQGQSIVTLNANNVDINADGAVVALHYNAISDGSKENQSSDIVINANNNVNLSANNWAIKAHSTAGYEEFYDDEGHLIAYGDPIYREDHLEETNVNITAGNNLKIVGTNGAIFAVAGNENGANVTVDAKNITIIGDIYADTNGNVVIGGDKLETAKIDGNITAIDSDVEVNLGTQGSFTGWIKTDGESIVESANETVKVMGVSADKGSNVTLNMGKGSTWYVTGDSTVSNISGEEGTIKIDNTGVGQVTVETSTVEDLTLAGSSDVTDSLNGNDIAGSIKEFAGKLEIGGEDFTGNVKLDSGSVIGETSAVIDENGNVTSVVEKANENNAGISEMASIGLMAWRAENNDMNKRLGELRNSNGEHGVWARMVRGESEYGSQSIKNVYNTYQLGYDEKLSTNDNWTVGAAISYTDAQSSFANGSGENTSKGLSFYGSYLGDNGEFVDLIAKYARLDNEFDVFGGAGSGDYSTNGYSFSAEFGKRNQLANDFYFEPQVELTYGRVADVDYVTSNKVKVSQDAMDSLVGRVGFAAGKNIKNGNVYVRASYLYDFDGETSVSFVDEKNNRRSFEQDLGGGWFEFGIGTNINLSDATYLYLDVEKTTGGEVDTNWQWNAGVRYSF